MKAHPAFIRLMDRLLSGWSNELFDWHFAGCPVVEEVNEARISDQIETRTRVEILKQLAAANARIKELEQVLERGSYQEYVRGWNEALEDAAKVADEAHYGMCGTAGSELKIRIADGIRGLKR